MLYHVSVENPSGGCLDTLTPHFRPISSPTHQFGHQLKHIHLTQIANSAKAVSFLSLTARKSPRQSCIRAPCRTLIRSNILILMVARWHLLQGIKAGIRVWMRAWEGYANGSGSVNAYGRGELGVGAFGLCQCSILPRLFANNPKMP